ncbi:MAG: glycoside hydrolase family 88 protein [Chloroflexi bacterium]|nr:glycoside hydrolase family 88 protein [Chloroflexota bacterium]
MIKDGGALAKRIHEALEFAGRQLRRLVSAHPDFFPMYTRNGKWKHSGEAWTNWCEGFLGGQLWLMHSYTGDRWWRDRAVHYSRLIEQRKADDTVHDLGFLFWSTWKRWYDLSPEGFIDDVLVEAGRTAGSRFRAKGGYLPSFVSAESTFIDIMMNVGIIFYAARQSKDETLWEGAAKHCETTRRYLVRGDGSVAHEGIFDTEAGEFLRGTTHQGWRDDSSWARGLTWAIYGFGTAFRFTGNSRFLHTAEACAAFYIQHTPAHGVPPNDWAEPDPAYPHESSAAAIAASAFLQLSELTADSVRAAMYRQYALRILDTLLEPRFLANDTPNWEGILKRGIYHQSRGLGVDESVMWGDYFLLEALVDALHVLRDPTAAGSARPRC